MGIEGLKFKDKNGNERTFGINEDIVGFLDRYGRYISDDNINNHTILAKMYLDEHEDMKADFEDYKRNNGKYPVESDWLVLKKGFVKVMQRKYRYGGFEKLMFTYAKTKYGKEKINSDQSREIYKTQLEFGDRKVGVEILIDDEENNKRKDKRGDFEDR